MSVTGIGNTGMNQPLIFLPGGISISRGSSVNNEFSASAVLDLSQPAQVFGKLQQLSVNDPERFSQLMTDVADKFDAAAQEEGDSSTGRMLGNMASQFRTAAETGDPSKMPSPGQGGPSGGQGPPPPGGMQGGGKSSGAMMRGISSYKQNESEESDTLLDLINSLNSSSDSTSSSWASSLKVLFSDIADLIDSSV